MGPSVKTASEADQMTQLPNIRLGVVGCGEHSHAHAAAAALVPGVELVAACDSDEARALAWASRYGCEAGYGRLADLVAHRALDGVILCTWPNLHAQQIEACLAAGIKNILCEKALVVSAAEARHVWRLAGEYSAQVVEASMHRHHPALRALERILAQEELGPIDSIRAAFHNYEPEDTMPLGETAGWRNRGECGGGVPHDWMHYLVDSCNHFSGSRPRRVFATGSASEHSGVIYRLYGLIEYESGLVGIVECSKLADFSNALQITGARGTLHLPIAWAIKGEVTITKTRRKPAWDFILKDTVQIGEANAFALELEDFVRVVRGVGVPLVPLRDSVVNALTTEALVTSLRRGAAVEVELDER